MKTLLDLCKRSNQLLEIDYFYDESGAAFWMEDLVLHGKPAPAVYCIVPKVRRIPFDIAIDAKYEGQTSFMIAGVPLRAKNEQTVVEVDTLRVWIICAIMEEDPYSRPFYVDIAKTKEIIKDIDKKIKQVSKMDFHDEGGRELRCTHRTFT